MSASERALDGRDEFRDVVRALYDDMRDAPQESWIPLDEVLDRVADYLESAEATYAARGRELPDNPWELMTDAFRAAVASGETTPDH